MIGKIRQLQLIRKMEATTVNRTAMYCYGPHHTLLLTSSDLLLTYYALPPLPLSVTVSGVHACMVMQNIMGQKGIV